jgi:hypothetical protein
METKAAMMSTKKSTLMLNMGIPLYNIMPGRIAGHGLLSKPVMHLIR